MSVICDFLDANPSVIGKIKKCDKEDYSFQHMSFMVKQEASCPEQLNIVYILKETEFFNKKTRKNNLRIKVKLSFFVEKNDIKQLIKSREFFNFLLHRGTFCIENYSPPLCYTHCQ